MVPFLFFYLDRHARERINQVDPRSDEFYFILSLINIFHDLRKIYSEARNNMQ